ncbi:MAG: insulinase family protein [Myxococcales bacterium]|nr:insulinase family protein [Myxococcales bacterium]
MSTIDGMFEEETVMATTDGGFARRVGAAVVALAALLALGAGCKGKQDERPDVATAPPAADAEEATAPPAGDDATSEATTEPSGGEDATEAAAPDAGGGEALGIYPDEAFRAERPKPAASADVASPDVIRFKLESGLDVYFVPDTKLPVLFMSFEFDVGGASDPKGKTGLASVCMDLYSESTADKDKIAFAEASADHATSIWTPSGAETSTINVRTLRREMGPALDLLAELIKTPGMRQDDFDRIIQKRKADLVQSRGTADAIARRLAPMLLWGEGHPLGAVQVEADLDAITLADCKAFVGKLLPSGARLWVTGMTTQEELQKELDARLGFWKGDAPEKIAIPPADEKAGTIFFVNLPGAVQSAVGLGQPGPLRTAEDYEATYLMAQILGGSFSSRVNMNLREDKGWAYGAFGGFSYRRQGSTFAMMASVEVSTTALAVAEMAREVRVMRTSDVKPEELQRERDGALRVLPSEFATPTKTIEELKRLVFFGLPLDWYESYQKNLRAVDIAAIRKAAEEHLFEKGQVVFVVGDGNAPAKDGSGTVFEALQKLADEQLVGEGGLVVLDADGKPAPKPEAPAAPAPKPDEAPKTEK